MQLSPPATTVEVRCPRCETSHAVTPGGAVSRRIVGDDFSKLPPAAVGHPQPRGARGWSPTPKPSQRPRLKSETAVPRWVPTVLAILVAIGSITVTATVVWSLVRDRIPDRPGDIVNRMFDSPDRWVDDFKASVVHLRQVRTEATASVREDDGAFERWLTELNRVGQRFEQLRRRALVQQPTDTRRWRPIDDALPSISDINEASQFGEARGSRGIDLKRRVTSIAEEAIAARTAFEVAARPISSGDTDIERLIAAINEIDREVWLATERRRRSDGTEDGEVAEAAFRRAADRLRRLQPVDGDGPSDLVRTLPPRFDSALDRYDYRLNPRLSSAIDGPAFNDSVAVRLYSAARQDLLSREQSGTTAIEGRTSGD